MPPEPDDWDGPAPKSEPAGTPAAVVFEDETVERPIVPLRLRAPAGEPARWMARWLLWSGTVACVFAFVAAVTALLAGATPVDWRGPLVAFDGAVLLLLLREFLAAGTPPGLLCRRAFAVAGLAAAVLVLLGVLLRSAAGFVFGVPPGELMTDLFVFGLLGLAGCLVFLQCLRGRGWAARTAALSGLVYLLLLAAQPLTGYRLFAGPPRVPLAFLARYWPVALAPALCVAGLAALAESSGRRAVRGVAMAGCWAVAGLLAGLGARQLAFEFGLPGAAGRLTVLAALWVCAGALPVMLGGIALLWRRRSPVGGGRADMYEATGFGTSLVALGALACLALWAPAHLGGDPLALLLVCLGLLAAVAGAWLAETQGDWVSRWALVPGVGLVVATFGALGWLARFARRVGAPHGELWALGTAWLWCPLGLGLTFGVAGLVVRRSRLRARQPGAAARADLRAVCSTAWLAGALLLWALLALAAGTPGVRRGVARAFAACGAVGQDLLAIAAGRWAARLAAGGAELLGRLPGGVLGWAAATLLAAALLLHLLAALRVGWALLAVAALWAVPLGAGTLLALGYASRLFLPLTSPTLGTRFGRAITSSFALRLLLLVAAAGLLARLWEATASLVRLWRVEALAVFGPAAATVGGGGGGPGRGSRLVFAVRVGLLGLACGLALSLLPARSDVPGALHLLRHVAGALAALGVRAGRLCTDWPGYAAAAGMLALLLIGLHDEAWRGRPAAYPLVAVVWMAGVAALLPAWHAALRSRGLWGGWALLTLAAAMLCALGCAAALWRRWWRLRGVEWGTAGGELERPGPAWPARCLGPAGLAGCLALGLAVLHGALLDLAAYRAGIRVAAGWAQGLVAGAMRGTARIADLLTAQGRLWIALALPAVALAGWLVLRRLAARRVRWAGRALQALSGVLAAALAGAVVACFARWPLGSWRAEHLLALLLITIWLMRVLLALVCADERPPEAAG